VHNNTSTERQCIFWTKTFFCLTVYTSSFTNDNIDVWWSLRWKNRERKEGGRVLHAVYSVTCGEFPTRNIILPYNSNYAAHRLIKWYWNNSVMSLKRYKSKYMRQNVLNYTFFFKRILEAMRKLYISLLVVESKFGCKNKKV